MKLNATPNVTFTESLVFHLDAIMQTRRGGTLWRSVISKGKFNVSNLPRGGEGDCIQEKVSNACLCSPLMRDIRFIQPLNLTENHLTNTAASST